MTNKHSTIKTSYYRRLYVAYSIATGSNTVPLLLIATKMHRRTLQEAILTLGEIDIICTSTGGTKNKCYSIEGWGAINKNYIKNNLLHIVSVLN